MNQIKALLVDDEIDFARMLAKRLGKREVLTEIAGSGLDGLQFLAANEVDVVVLDVKMPGISGIETLRRLKADHPLIEVILLTGHADMEAAILGMELGAFDYLMKPMDVDELLYKIQDAAKRKRFQEVKIREMKDFNKEQGGG